MSSTCRHSTKPGARVQTPGARCVLGCVTCDAAGTFDFHEEKLNKALPL